jgi:pimeloyl-ACP methyl ester carboxylesterase
MSGPGASDEAAPLARFGGERPPAPAWYARALAAAPESLEVDVYGARIEALAWGEAGRPGLLLMHGAGGHAGWWRAVAPYLARDFRVAAFSLSGMGGSGWRARYSMDTYADEALAVAQAAGLTAAGPPVVAGHSFGGRAALRLAAREGEKLRAAVVIDTIIRDLGQPGMGRGLWAARPTRVYPTLAAALARFRLAPLQPCENLFLVDAVARESLGPPKAANGEAAEGWTWTFDPMLWAHLDDPRTAAEDLVAVRCPTALVFGERSKLMGPREVATARRLAPGSPVCIVPEAGHHIMLDQPLALAAALGALLAGWPNEDPR